MLLGTIEKISQAISPKAGGTHIAMFVSWCVLNGLAGEIHASDSPELLGQLISREVTPCE